MRRFALAAPFLFVMAACTAGPDDADETAGTEMPATVPADPQPGTVAPGAMPVPDGEPAATADPEEDMCGASKVQSYIGQEATVPVRTEVARIAGSASDRWIYPDSIVTQDLRMDRLNVVMERGTDKIISIKCG